MATTINETIQDRYRRCGFLNSIQHVDIYGKNKSSYVEHKLKIDPPLVTSISNSSPEFTKMITDPELKKGVKNKLDKFSVSTKVCGLYPGNDILSKKSKFRKLSKSNFTFCALK